MVATALNFPPPSFLCYLPSRRFSLIPSLCGHCCANYHPARMASGERLAMNPVAVFHAIITQRLAREKPDGFVIPLTILQVRFLVHSIYPDFTLPSTRIPGLNTALGRHLSKSFSSNAVQSLSPRTMVQEQRPTAQRSCSYTKEPGSPVHAPRLQSSASLPLPRAQLLPLCGATFLSIPTIQR